MLARIHYTGQDQLWLLFTTLLQYLAQDPLSKGRSSPTWAKVTPIQGWSWAKLG